MKELIRPFANFILDILLFLLKRNKSIVVCSGWSGERFADNSRYLFQYLNENEKQLNLHKIVWITQEYDILRELRKAGYTVYMRNSIISMWFQFRARYFFYDQFSSDFIVFLTRNAKLINMWHGMPIKKFGLWNGTNWDLKDNYLLTCSPFGDETIGKAFHVDTKRFIHGMYPRNYYLVHDIPFLTKEESSYMEMLQKQQARGKKILFYLPTYRMSKLLFLGEESEQKVEAFLDFLYHNDYYLITKVHYAGFFNYKDTNPFSEECILNLSPKTDIYPFLKQTDILITDYSSVLFDFLYLNRDIICYCYDLYRYEHEDKGLLFDYQTLPADKVFTLGELETNLREKKNHRDKHEAARKLWLEKCFAEKTMEDTLRLSLC